MKKFDSSDYIRKTYRQYLVRMHRIEDARIIQKLDSEENQTAYIRNLINKDLEEPAEKEANRSK